MKIFATVVGMLALSACDVKIHAIDLKASGTSKNSLNGGCDDPNASGTAASSPTAASSSGGGSTTATVSDLISATIDRQTYAKSINTGPTDGCIQSVGGLSFTSTVDSVTASDNCTDDSGAALSPNPGGKLALGAFSLTLSADKGPAAITVACDEADIDVTDSAGLAAAGNACGNAHACELKEWLRGAINAKANSIKFDATAGCSTGACFQIAYTVKVRLSDVDVHAAEGCDAYKTPTCN